jgi:hypothetical protein
MYFCSQEIVAPCLEGIHEGQHLLFVYWIV